jgi:hypothetical protein
MIGTLIAAAASLAAAAPAAPAASSTPASPSVSDAATTLGPKLARLRGFARTKGERLWTGYGTASFGFLLVGEQSETLLCHPSAPAGFVPAGRDPATGCVRLTRGRSGLSGGLLAAMPLFGPPSTIVMGSPAATGRPEGDWLRTILHEHFHQWQSALPAYYSRVAALDLAGGDQSGMWMLNFPFPYSDAGAAAGFAAVSNALADALQARNSPGFLPAFDAFLAARRAFAARVGERDWRYFEFQLWQEGVARWTEITLGRAYPDAGVRSASAAFEARTLSALRTPDLAARRREAVYPYGAGEAMLLEACGRAWRKAYPGVLALGPLLAEARARCARN